MPKRQKSISQLKKEVWSFCSEYNRRKDADEWGFVDCATCGVRKHWKKGDAGHFLPGRWNAILFYDQGIHFQCKPCNGKLRNRRVENVDKAYRTYMSSRYGPKVVKEIEKLKCTTRQFSAKELLEKLEGYREKIKKLN